MAIDDPIDAFEQQYMKEELELPTKLAKFVGDTGFKLALPDGGLALEILLKVNDALFDRASATERVKATWGLVKGEFRHVETTKASHDDVQKAIQLAIWYDRHERDDQKRERFINLARFSRQITAARRALRVSVTEVNPNSGRGVHFQIALSPNPL